MIFKNEACWSTPSCSHPHSTEDFISHSRFPEGLAPKIREKGKTGKYQKNNTFYD